MPGSLAFYLFSDTLKGFSVMLDKMVIEAQARHARSSTQNRKFNSAVLSFTRAGILWSLYLAAEW